MGVTQKRPELLNSADSARYLALLEQRKTVGLNASDRDELKALEEKIRQVK